MDVSAAYRDWLILLYAPGLGPRTYQEILSTHASPGRFLAAGPSAWQRTGLDAAACAALAHPDATRLARDLEWLSGPDNHLITLLDPRYPRLLREISDPPPLLFVHGNPGLLAEPQLAIVGSRNPSADGEQNAREFSRHLAAAGLAITSGLALGIDAAAHRGALDVAGSTLAVTGTGLDRVYPASHRDLAHAIAEGGALVSEFPPGTPPLPENFPRRNRLISGLSLGVLVVEAALRSGSLITARLAAEQGREVFAIPGSIHNPLARGCHAVIRQGAKLVETAQDIIEELGPLAGVTLATPPAGESVTDPAELDADYRQLLDQLGHGPLAVDQLVDRSGLTAEAVSSMLLIMELQGLVASVPGGRYVRASIRGQQ